MKILLSHIKYGKFSGEGAIIEAKIDLLRETAIKLLSFSESKVVPSVKAIMHRV